VARAAPAGANAQIWTELEVDAPLTDRLSVSGLATLRLADGLPNPSFTAAGGVLSYAVGPQWSFAAGDYFVRVRSAASGQALDLQLPLAALTYATSMAGFEIADRNRAERIVGLTGEDWRYRNRILVTHPLAIGPVRSVFASDEVFYDVARERWSRNRGQVGIGLTPVGRASLQVYLLRQDDRFSRPGHLNVLGLAMALRL
jgi:hypothetical protein